MTLDLSAAVDFIASIMDDACAVTRNPRGQLDATLDTDTGKLAPPTATAVYTGKCKITSLRDSQPTTTPRDGFDEDSRFYRFGIPLGTNPMAIGDTVTITTSLRFPIMVGWTFVVRELVGGTFSVQQRVVVERRVWTGKGDV